MSVNIIERKAYIQQQILRAKERGGFEHDVTLIAVTKYQTIEAANDAISAGIDNVAENHVQSLTERSKLFLPCKKHFIGHLQTNKVKQLLSVEDLVLIQSVDSVHLAEEISKQAVKAGKCIDILIQVNIANEETKFGLRASEIHSSVEAAAQLPGICIKGFMSIMPIETKKEYYEAMYDLYGEYKAMNIDNTDFKFLSMGMSGDFETAVECGSNMVRIGSYLFK